VRPERVPDPRVPVPDERAGREPYRKRREDNPHPVSRPVRMTAQFATHRV
jgi:hypothetical protein